MEDKRTEREKFLDAMEMLYVEIVLRDTVFMTYDLDRPQCANWQSDLETTRRLHGQDARRRFADIREQIAQQPDPELLVRKLLEGLGPSGSVQ